MVLVLVLQVWVLSFIVFLSLLNSVLGTSLPRRSTVAFTYLKVKSAFVYFHRFWSWSRSCYFGLGFKNLVLFRSDPVISLRLTSSSTAGGVVSWRRRRTWQISPSRTRNKMKMTINASRNRQSSHAAADVVTAAAVAVSASGGRPRYIFSTGIPTYNARRVDGFLVSYG